MKMEELEDLRKRLQKLEIIPIRVQNRIILNPNSKHYFWSQKRLENIQT